MDGNALPPRKDVHDFAFTRDGRHYRFFLAAPIRRMEIGLSSTGWNSIWLRWRLCPFATSSREEHGNALFSPDGKHVLYLASLGETDASGRYSADDSPIKGVCLDGKLISCEGETIRSRRLFTPDSKHVVWIDWGGKPSEAGPLPGISLPMSLAFPVYVDGHWTDILTPRAFTSRTRTPGPLAFFAITKMPRIWERMGR